MGIFDSLFRFFGIENNDIEDNYRRIWAIGDIQGCNNTFRELLNKIEFDATQDRLWIAGDLVNRGEGSLEVLEYLYKIKNRINIVLGNHDITLLAVHWGIKKSNQTLDPILQSPNRNQLLEWLRSQPFVHYDPKINYVMVHAGIPPAFDLGMALEYSKRLQQKLQSADAPRWLTKKMLGGVHTFGEKKKNRFAINAFTRMRFCDQEGNLDFDQKGAPNPKTYDSGFYPWFEVKNRKKLGAKVIFGHWSTLGYMENKDVICLDTGCVWQGKMTAKRIDIPDGEIVQVDCPEGAKPL
ncbi:MAG: symmetrical bis(5'-nucleosyl)-tetraphosphatase [Sulfurovum sp.]|nr:symmetrical bis(5'-nucleosyl)-tetraphosphatase [Sulfurovum sp.]